MLPIKSPPKGWSLNQPVGDFLPKQSPSYVPEKWRQWQHKWYNEGLARMPTPKEGIDLFDAIEHLLVIQRAWSIDAYTKQKIVAYLASEWFKEE